MHDVVPGDCHTVQHYIGCWMTFFDAEALQVREWSMDRNEISKTFNKILTYTEKNGDILAATRGVGQKRRFRLSGGP
ncbi:hypothetical protein LB561_03070 [Mesorhizobium sp. B292B1B]|uniref:hypothetical protein n=1 Tax=unclassified Mesorhizobium TaxID=325217 RepID=UPI00112C07D3|nr:MULTISPECIES: hypothetical protein [unclassified Mesorhizobium]MCA0010539.1 hypothetical protein [Mesorhizobium sp. B294B1A1]MCA0036267.1 hypothetical protein [Mesorhizobium sp. B292B1B]TPM49343.1 hypothetical protein FJ964_08255 [Mesorhizobium sp. B2-3-2]